MTKSRFTLWGPMRDEQGYRRWGVNEKKYGSLYTYGPHAGYFSRKDAEQALQEARKEEQENKRSEQ